MEKENEEDRDNLLYNLLSVLPTERARGNGQKIEIYGILLEHVGGFVVVVIAVVAVVVVRVPSIVSSYPESLWKYPWIYSTSDWTRP